MTEDCNCPGENHQFVRDVRAIGDNPYKGIFYRELLPQMLTPRRYRFILDIEALANFQDCESMSAQVVLAELDTLEALIQDAKDINDELDSIPDLIAEDAAGIAEVITAKWPFDCTVSLREVPRTNHLEES
jgi:hypothetical protein